MGHGEAGAVGIEAGRCAIRYNEKVVRDVMFLAPRRFKMCSIA